MKILNIEENPFHEIPYRSSGKGSPRFCSLPFYFVEVDKLPENINSIIVTSDLQGRNINPEINNLLGEVVAEELLMLKELEMIPNFEIIISAGDLYDKPELNKYGADGNVTSVLNAFSNVTENVIAVHGNHDIVDEKKLNKNITILDGNSINISNIKVSGVSGIIGKIGRTQRKTEENYFKLLKKITQKNIDIILLHQTPKGNKPYQIGDKGIQEHFINKGQSLIIAGHCHWDNHLAKLGKNQLLNTDSKVFILKEIS